MGHEDRRNASEQNKQMQQKLKRDGVDVEFSEALADHNDKEAMARMNAADKRAKENNKQWECSCASRFLFNWTKMIALP
ncbi:YfhD family protein [Bacillus sp. N9]